MDFTIPGHQKSLLPCYHRLRKNAPWLLAFCLLFLGSAVAGASSLEINTVPDQTVQAGSPVAFTVSATGPEPSLIEYGVINSPSDASFNSETGDFSWVPEDSGDYELQFYATDGNSTATEDVTIIVTALPNNAPTIQAQAPHTVEVGKYLSFTLAAYDPDGDTLSYINGGELPQGASLDPNSGTFEWTPAAGQEGTYEIEFTVSDGSLSAAGSVAITVINENSGANATLEMLSISPKTVVVNNTLQFTVSASGGNGTLIFSATQLPSGATFDNSTQLFKWIPSASNLGTHSAVFTVTDGMSSDAKTASITVTAASNSSTNTTGGSGSSGGSSSGSGSSSSGGGGGGFQASTEKYENIEFKDFSIKYVLRDVDNVFNFSMENNSISSVIVVTRRNEGETKTIIEMLKGTSTMVNKAAHGVVYRNVNIWVGDDKFSNSNLQGAKVKFTVEKTWLAENSIDPASIKLLRYSDTWSYLPTSIAGEDETFVHYTAFTPGFSVFAISGVDESAFAPAGGEQNVSQSNEDENTSLSVDDEQGATGTVPVSQERKSSSFILFVLVGMGGIGVAGYRYKEQVNEMLFRIGNSDGKRYRRIKR
ncbi:MAG: PGF-pre-PGF domain-containing protein [Methanolobus sp.]|uniref:PGF-pre-PGF domain-containing protein n=1 Tax=Methanolobus sp. TaxID=1874737 RepID=UPI0027308947|nr:PGF-pre-PGF domain-containing protein [Methanolobus sp.]MDP2217330.1 PGF-pre-PGF domain-containing protein [Methanolobus sp.]